jgi:hypothetical protein
MYTPIIIGSKNISEDLLSLGEMVLCAESEKPCENCVTQLEQYEQAIRPSILELSKIWANYSKTKKDLVLKAIFEDYDLNKICEAVNYKLND